MDPYEALLNVLQDQYRRYDHIEAVDLYKLIYQVSFGAKHSLKDIEAARAGLMEEWRELGKLRKGEALLDQIDPEGLICRVNLRIYRKTGGTPEALWDIFKMSARDHAAEPSKFHDYWKMIIEMAGAHAIPARVEVLHAFWDEMKAGDFPPSHHSVGYIEANAPAYRLVMTQRWLAEMSGQQK